MSYPADFLYAASHEWADITYVELPAVGDTVSAGKEFGSVESVKAASDLISPVSGEIVAVNDTLENAPEQINAKPHEAWIIRVKLSGKPEGLMDAAAYEEHCNNEHH